VERPIVVITPVMTPDASFKILITCLNDFCHITSQNSSWSNFPHIPSTSTLLQVRISSPSTPLSPLPLWPSLPSDKCPNSPRCTPSSYYLVLACPSSSTTLLPISSHWPINSVGVRLHCGALLIIQHAGAWTAGAPVTDIQVIVISLPDSVLARSLQHCSRPSSTLQKASWSIFSHSSKKSSHSSSNSTSSRS
jgi:hypothetical protein